MDGHLAFGTIDSFLIWRLTGGRVHATDATNASRTLLCNIHDAGWDGELLDIFGVPENMLPEIHDCSADYGETDPALFGGPISICGVAGDQQAATVGQACFEPGMLKSTYGTGCFALLNTGLDSGLIEQPSIDNHCLQDWPGYYLCPGRVDICRRRRGAVAQGRSWCHFRCGPDRGAGR